MKQAVDPKNATGVAPFGRPARRKQWLFILLAVVFLVTAGIAAYQWFKGKRADRFAAAGQTINRSAPIPEHERRSRSGLFF